MLKSVLKRMTRLAAAAAVFPAAALSGFGRAESVFVLFAQALAFAPGLPGTYLRVAYYSLTLESCGRDCRVEFGSYFAHPKASMGDRAAVGGYCILGHVNLGEGAMAASGTQILSGTKQHVRNADGRLSDEGSVYKTIVVGRNCWIGAGSVIAANLGDGVTVAPGSVVLRSVRAGATVAGNPAFSVGDGAETQPAAAERAA